MSKLIAIWKDLNKSVLELRKRYEVYFFLLRFNSRNHINATNK